jgi:hypothetical protein
VVTEAAPPRRRLLSRLFGRDKEGDGAEEIFSAPVVSQPRPAVVQAPAVPPAPRMTAVPAPAPVPAPPAPVVSQPHPAVAHAPAVAPPPRMTAVPAPAPVPAPPLASPPKTQPDYMRRDSVITPAQGPAAAARTAPARAPAPAPAVVQAPAPAPVVKTAPAPVVVGATAKPFTGEPVIVNNASGGLAEVPRTSPARPFTGEPVIVNKGADGRCACVPGEPVIVSEPRRPVLSRLLKPSDEKVTTVVTSTPVVVTPDKGKPAEAAKAPAIVSGPVSAKAVTPAPNAGTACAPTGAPLPAGTAGASPPKVTPPVVKASAEPAKPGDWRQSWGNATPRSESVAPRPTTWSQPSAPAAPRADRIVFPKPESPKPDPLADPASYSRVARQDLVKKAADTTGATPRPEVSAPALALLRPEATGPTGRGGPMGVQVAANEGNAFSPPQPVTPPQQPTMSNAFPAAQARQAAATAPAGYLPPALPTPPAPPGYALGRPYYPPAPTYVTGGTPTGLANAFTPASNARPIPADFAPPQVAANCFSGPDQPAPAGRTGPPAAPVPGYFPPMARGYGPAPYGRPIAQASQPAVSPPQLLATLRDSLLPSQREWAADQLAGLDWRAHPQTVEALLSAAHSDPAPAVRAGCVRALAKMRANTGPVVAAVEGLRRDADPRVRQEAEEALTALGGAAPRNDSGVRPASAGLR